MPKALCQAAKFASNRVAYQETTETLCLIAKQQSGGDHALNEAGLVYLEEMKAKGALLDGKPVRQVFVVLANEEETKVHSFRTPEAIRKRLNGRPPKNGTAGRYWWIEPSGSFSDNPWIQLDTE